MALHIATLQNVILMEKNSNINKVLSSIEKSEKAKGFGLFVKFIDMEGGTMKGLSLSTSKPSFNAIYSGEVFEFETPYSIKNEDLESKVTSFLETFTEFLDLKGDYKLTRAGIRTIAIS